MTGSSDVKNKKLQNQLRIYIYFGKVWHHLKLKNKSVCSVQYKVLNIPSNIIGNNEVMEKSHCVYGLSLSDYY